MALPANRVGVARSEVDSHGRIKTGTSTPVDTYTKSQIDSKMANKVSKSQLTANDEHFYFDYQNGQYGYNTEAERGADTFHPFSVDSQPEIAYYSGLVGGHSLDLSVEYAILLVLTGVSQIDLTNCEIVQSYNDNLVLIRCLDGASVKYNAPSYSTAYVIGLN